jgi:galactonate dehydratase
LEKKRFLSQTGGVSVKIIDIEPVIVHVNHRGDWVFVLVHTDAGITGLGEASHSGNDALLLATLDVFKQQLVGVSPLQINEIWHRLARVDGGRITHTALSGIEQALWDIAGQHMGVPIHALFGGALRDRIRLYANINRHVTDRSPEGFARAARQAVDEGFTAVKLAPFDELRAKDHVRTGPQAAWRTGVARVEAVRAAIGDEIDLAIDCHGRMEASEAILVADALAGCHLFWYEEPVPRKYLDELAHVSRSVRVTTASAENVFGMEGFRPFLTRRIVDVLMPDVKHAGGLLETANIAQAARMSQLLVAPHNPSGPVATVASGHVTSTMSNFLILEYAWGEAGWRADLLAPREPIEAGYLTLSQAPGLGYRLNPETVEAHRAGQASAVDSTKVVVQ